jgi:hypothetical protein
MVVIMAPDHQPSKVSLGKNDNEPNLNYLTNCYLHSMSTGKKPKKLKKKLIYS